MDCWLIDWLVFKESPFKLWRYWEKAGFLTTFQRHMSWINMLFDLHKKMYFITTFCFLGTEGRTLFAIIISVTTQGFIQVLYLMSVVRKKIYIYKGKSDGEAIIVEAWGLGESPVGFSVGKAPKYFGFLMSLSRLNLFKYVWPFYGCQALKG